MDGPIPLFTPDLDRVLMDRNGIGIRMDIENMVRGKKSKKNFSSSNKIRGVKKKQKVTPNRARAD